VTWKIETIPVPVADIDRALAFYGDTLGFPVDLDLRFPDGSRTVQITPPGSGCSIHLNSALTRCPAGSLEGVQIVVDDVAAARQYLLDRGVQASPVRHYADGEWRDGHGGRWNAFVFFDDPDGNSWVLQERPAESD